MPSIRPKGGGADAEPRSTFRPPWVKDGPPPLPAPPPAWMGNRPPPQQNQMQPKQDGAIVHPKLKEVRSNSIKEKTIAIKIERESTSGESSKNKNHEVNEKKSTTATKASALVKSGDEKKVRINREERTQHNNILSNEAEKKVSIQIPENKVRGMNKEESPAVEISKENCSRRGSEDKRKIEQTRIEQAPPLPPPMPPPRPPLPPTDIQRKPLSESKKQKLEALKSRPRRRPDWTDMMKEVEKGIKLQHVTCNDRSAPVLPKAKAKGQFVYESEKQNAHNQLLKEIQSGVALKKVKTNDRSKPILDGLRKFRRQMTIEEQIQKSASVADVIAVAAEPDELDDIDKVRDDLQSTKQMLALEMRNKEALERENKRLMARLLNLEAELEKEKLTRNKLQVEGTQIVPVRTEQDEKLIAKLKEEAFESAKMAKEMEEQYHKTAEELDLTRAKLESSWLRNSQLEMELKSKGNSRTELVKQRSVKRMSSVSQQAIIADPSDKYLSETETESDEVDEDDSIDQMSSSTASREERQYNLLCRKVKNLKEKRMNASREKKNLKQQLNKLQSVLKDEKKRYRMLQAEVEKMASIMRDVEEGDESAGEEGAAAAVADDENYTDDESEENEHESDSESSTAELESDGEANNDLSLDEKIKFMEKKVKNYESLFNRSKKANYLLKANIDRRQDDLNRQKELSLALQEDLNAVLSELG